MRSEPDPRHRMQGFTLIEIVLTILAFAIAIPVLLTVLGQGAKQGVNAELEVGAANVAEAMLEEIRAKKWDQNSPIPPGAYTNPLGPEAGETRTACTETPSSFNDISDYNGYTETCTWNGAAYATQVEVCYVDPSDLTSCIGLSNYKRIKVTVTNSYIGAVELVTLVSNY